MKFTIVLTLVALFANTTLAQDSVEIAPDALAAPVSIEVDGQASITSVLDEEGAATIQPVVFQSGSTTRGAVGNAVGNAVGGSATRSSIQGTVVEPSSVINGQVIQSQPAYGGTVISGGGFVQESPVADCGCGASAPVATHSPAPVECSAPAEDPCCCQPQAEAEAQPQRRRGFFRALFGR